MAVAAAAGVAAAAVVVAKEMANAKQTVEAEAKTQQSTFKKQKNGSEDDGRSGVAAVSGRRQREDGCGVSQGNGRGRRGGGATEETAEIVITECSGRRLTLSTTITAPAKAGTIPAQTMMAEAAVVARRIATPPCDPAGLHRLSRWSARRRTLPPR